MKNIKGLWFEWDEDKNRSNFTKHGIDFETAALVFHDENRLEFYDALHSGGEDRYQTIGLVHKVLFVVFTERRNKIRLISARPAHPLKGGCIMITTVFIPDDQEPTPEQIAMIEAACRRPITFDADCPEITPQTCIAFQRAVSERRAGSQPFMQS